MISSIPRPIIESLEAHFGRKVSHFSAVGGGCINNGGKLSLQGGIHHFVKWNHLERFPGMFDVEARGLNLLRSSDSIAVPGVVHSGTAARYQYLVLDYIDEGRRLPDYWYRFGRQLAAMHRHSTPAHGLDHDNYVGSLPQKNDPDSSWISFFIHRRLEPQLRRAVDDGRIDRSAVAGFERLFAKLQELLPEESPSLLHGDLWGGNIMITSAGEPCLIDPAVYFGHREVDLAMTQLFGGFDHAFLDSYHEEFPLIPGYRERFEIYNLYPLLVHVNLFGGIYVHQVVSIVDQLV